MLLGHRNSWLGCSNCKSSGRSEPLQQQQELVLNTLLQVLHEVICPRGEGLERLPYFRFHERRCLQGGQMQLEASPTHKPPAQKHEHQTFHSRACAHGETNPYGSSVLTLNCTLNVSYYHKYHRLNPKTKNQLWKQNGSAVQAIRLE